MKAAKIGIVVLPLLVLSVVGCSTSRQVGYQTWIYVTTPGLDTLSGYPGEAALRPFTQTTNRIQITVRGEVMCPGNVRVPAGCSVIQAIGYVGGFTPYAHAHHFWIYRSSGEHGRLTLRSKRPWPWGHKRVWYVFEVRAQDTTRVDVSAESDTDYILEDGDTIVVGRLAL